MAGIYRSVFYMVWVERENGRVDYWIPQLYHSRAGADALQARTTTDERPANVAMLQVADERCQCGFYLHEHRNFTGAAEGGTDCAHFEEMK